MDSAFASVIAIVADDHGVVREYGFGQVKRLFLESTLVELLADELFGGAFALGANDHQRSNVVTSTTVNPKRTSRVIRPAISALFKFHFGWLGIRGLHAQTALDLRLRILGILFHLLCPAKPPPACRADLLVREFWVRC